MSRTTTAAAAVALALSLAACSGGGAGPGPTGDDEFGNSSTPAVPSTSKGDAAGSSGGSTTGDSAEGGPTEGDAEGPGGPSASSSPTNTGTPFDPEEFTAKLEAAIETDSTVRIDVTMTAGGQETATATGVQDLANDALDMQVDMNGQELGYRLVDGRYYLAQPPKWVPVTEESTNPLIEQALDQVQPLSMRKQLDAFIAGVEDAGDKGTEEIDGVETRHYTAAIDTATAREHLGTKQDPNAPETLTYDIWLDEDDRIRKMVLTQEGSRATLTAKDWGEPVDITAPKDSELARAS